MLPSFYSLIFMKKVETVYQSVPTSEVFVAVTVTSYK